MPYLTSRDVAKALELVEKAGATVAMLTIEARPKEIVVKAFKSYSSADSTSPNFEHTISNAEALAPPGPILRSSSLRSCEKAYALMASMGATGAGIRIGVWWDHDSWRVFIHGIPCGRNLYSFCFDKNLKLTYRSVRRSVSPLSLYEASSEQALAFGR